MYLYKAKTHSFKIISLGVCFVLIFSSVFPLPAFASRSDAGGGELAEFDAGDFAKSVGISLGSMAIGSAIYAGVSSLNSAEAAARAAGDVSCVGMPGLTSSSPGFLSAMGDSFAKSFNLDNMISGLITFGATSQVGRAVSAAGNYYGWDPSSTFWLSNIASGATGGFLNSSIALGDTIPTSVSLTTPAMQSVYYTSLPTMARGALVGGLTGLASGGAIVAIDGGRMDDMNLPPDERRPGVGAQIAGMVAGVAAGNFARELVNPVTYSKQTLDVYKQVPNPNPEIKNLNREIADLEYLAAQSEIDNIDEDVDMYLDAEVFRQEAGRLRSKLQQIDRHMYQKVLETHPFTGKNPELDPTLHSWSDLKARYEDKGISVHIEPIGDFRKVVQINADLGISDIGAKLLDATFIKTADMWPQLATRSLSILAVDSLGKDDQKFAPLVSSVVEGITRPAFSGLADYLALRPGLYVGENRITNSIAYLDNMFKPASKSKSDKVAIELNAVYEDYKDRLAVADRKTEEFEQTREEYQQKIQEVLTTNKLNIGILDPIQLIETQRVRLDKEVENGGITRESAEPIYGHLDRIKSELTQGYNPRMHMGIVMGGVNQALQAEIKEAKDKGQTLDQVFAKMGTDRASLFLSSAMKEIKFGLSEGAVSGGTSYLTSKLSKDDPLAGAAGAYGAAMLTSALRGAIWYATWEENRDLEWMPKYTHYMPKPPKPYEEGDNWVEQKVSQYIYDQQLAKVNEFGRVSGLRLVEREREVLGKKEPVSGYELDFKGQKPDLTIAVLASLAQTNREFLNRTFAFGAPQTEPKHINTFMMSDYFKQLNSYAMSGSNPNWLSSGLTSGMLSAGSSAISSNILTSLAAFKPTAEFFNMQRQRLVLTGGNFVNNTNPNPFTIQTSDYKPGALGFETGFYIPFLSDSYRARSRTGQSFIKE